MKVDVSLNLDKYASGESRVEGPARSTPLECVGWFDRKSRFDATTRKKELIHEACTFYRYQLPIWN